MQENLRVRRFEFVLLQLSIILHDEQSKYVFAQLIEFLDNNKFRHLVDKYDGNRYVKHFTCWNQLLAMMFGQLSNRENLRDLIVAFEAHRAKQYHLGLGRKPIAKTTFASANQNRDYHIFEDFAFYMMEQARKKRVTDIFKLKGNVYAFDSTAMKEIPYESGSYYVFDRGYNAFKELFKIHQHESFFVVRAKKNLQYKCCKWRRRLPKNILTDAEIEFTEYYSFRKYPEKLRLVKFYDEEQGREFVFLTNALHLTAAEIANFYKNRWQIELFFKWLKQHLKIKKFGGTTENAVRIQISSAIIAYCLVAIVQHDLHLKRSTYEVLQILSISLMDKTPLVDLFERSDFNNVKELGCPLFPGLFD